MAVYTVGDGKAFNLIQTAVDAIPGNLAGQGLQDVQVYAKAPLDEYNESLNIYTGFTNGSAVNYIEVQAMINHGGLATGGIKIVDPGTVLPTQHIHLYQYTRFHGFVCKGAVVNKYHNGISFDDYARIYNNIVYGYGSSWPTDTSYANGLYSYGHTPDVQVYNNIIYNIHQTNAAGGDSKGIYVIANSGTALLVYNNDVHNCTVANGAKVAYGIQTYHNHNRYKIRNNVCMNNGTADFQCGANNVVEYNISSDSTADNYGGSGNLVDKVAANQFVSPGTDFHLKSGADCIRSGFDASAVLTDDIDYDARVDFNTGADEFTAPGPDPDPDPEPGADETHPDVAAGSCMLGAGADSGKTSTPESPLR